MEMIPDEEIQDTFIIKRFSIPEHKNSFLMQIISHLIFSLKVIKYSFKKRKDFDIVFATSSRLGTGFLGYIVSKINNKPLYLDIRDIFSDNIKSISFFSKNYSLPIIKLLEFLENQIISKASWVNFVSPGFFNYKHIKKTKKKIHSYTNGIDKIFYDQSNLKNDNIKKITIPITILYAGNIGFGQGLELITIPLAKYFKNKVKFKLIGDGSSLNIIKKEIFSNNLSNIKLYPPVSRETLLKYYNKADIFLLHLNDIPAFKNVLPSKIFDYGSYNKPILAGVVGVAKSFLNKNLPNSVLLFEPGDYKSAILLLKKYIQNSNSKIDNKNFINEFNRSKIMNEMVKSVIDNYLIN